MSSNKPSRGMCITDIDGNRVDNPGPMRWEPRARLLETDPVFKWELYIPHLRKGDRGEEYELGGMYTGIEVYRSGKISWPGKDIPPCASAEEAKAFVEATYALEYPEEVHGD